MKIWELDLKEGKKYECSDGRTYTVRKCMGELQFNNNLTGDITNSYMLSKLLSLDFKEYVDWSKVPIDTKVEVSDDGVTWYKRHFYEFLCNECYVFDDGRTSFTNVVEMYRGFRYYRLAE